MVRDTAQVGPRVRRQDHQVVPRPRLISQEQILAVHGIDVAPSLYNTRGALNGSSPAANELAAAIAGSWAAFAANGDPNNERVPEWKPYSAPRRTTMIFDQDLRVEDDPRAEFRKYWR